MHDITELNMLLRVSVELPVGMKVATREFCEGWGFARTTDAKRLEKRVQTRGWNFIKIGDGSLRSGVGETSQEAIANALKLALRRIGEHFNAVEVDQIELKRYPWFFLARVKVYPYRIQQEATPRVPDEAPTLPAAARQRRLPLDSAALYPGFGNAMPQFKQMLTASRGSEARPQ